MLVFKRKNTEGDKPKKFLKLRPFVLFCFCFFLYTPKFQIPSVMLQIITVGIPLLYVIANFKLIKNITKKQYIILLCAIILSVLSYVVPIIHGTEDFSYFLVSLLFFRKAIIYLALLCLIIKNHGKEKAMQYFIYYFAMTHVIYVIGTLILVLFPKLHDAWFSIVEKETMYGNTAGRLFRIGWRGFSGFRLTLYCTISVMFLIYLRYGAKRPEINKWQFILVLIGCITGNMFYGRSGLIVSLIISAIAFLYWNRKNIKRIVITIVAIAALALGVSFIKYIPGLSSWYNWMSSPIVNLVTTGDMQDKSFDKLQEMQKVEMNEETLFFGDGYYNEDDHYYMQTDAGHMRNILFWGLLGAILSYGATLYSIGCYKKFSKLLVFQFILVFIMFEYKGAVYYEFLPLGFIAATYLGDGSHD